MIKTQSVHQAYREWQLAKVDFTTKSRALQETFDKQIAPYAKALEDNQQKLSDELEAKKQRFYALMGDCDELDGVARKRPDPTKKNSYEVTFKLAPTQLTKLANQSDALKAIMKLSQPKETPNRSLVKQYVASGRFTKTGNHLVDQETGELLDEYIDVKLKDDEFEEAQS